jgi:hypothetical protein
MKRLVRKAQILDMDQALDFGTILWEVEAACERLRNKIHGQLNHTEDPVDLKHLTPDLHHLKNSISKVQEFLQ